MGAYSLFPLPISWAYGDKCLVVIMTPEKLKPIIVGGGIGGLTCAVTLAQAGIPCVLLEKTPEIGRVRLFF